jgi:hypothetical protein
MSGNPQITPSHFLLGEAYKQINCEAADPDTVRWQFLCPLRVIRFISALSDVRFAPNNDRMAYIRKRSKSAISGLMRAANSPVRQRS